MPERKNIQPEQKKMQNPFLRKFLDYLTFECGVSQATLEAYRRDIEQHIQFFEEQKIPFPQEINPLHYHHFLDSLRARGLRPTSLARKQSALRRLYQFLLEQQDIEEDPTRLSKVSLPYKRFKGALSHEEMKRLFDAIREKDPALRDRDIAMLELLYATGLRVSELSSMPGRYELSVQLSPYHRQGNRERLIFPQKAAKTAGIPENTRPQLCRKHASDTLFVNRFGKPMSRMGFWKILQNMPELPELYPIYPPYHTAFLRHHLLENGMDLRFQNSSTCQITTTEIYTHIDQRRCLICTSSIPATGVIRYDSQVVLTEASSSRKRLRR